MMPHCKNCDNQVVENTADFKPFYYCKACKVEVDAYGWRVKGEKAMEMDSYMFQETKSTQATQEDLDYYFSAPYLDAPYTFKK